MRSVGIIMAQQAAIAQTMRAWYEEGFAGAFGGTGFHFLSEASVDGPGRVLRWSADVGSADARRAIQTLANRLGMLDDVTVEHVIIGIEEAG